MADRFFWGTTKMDKVRIRKWMDLDVQSSTPTARQGRVYVDANGKMKISADGTTFVVVGSQS